MAFERGFTIAEYEQRTDRLQKQMHTAQVDAVVLTTEPHFRYFSGFFTPFWQSPTRPWFLVVPLAGKPVAVIPEIGVSGMSDTWIEDIRSWPAPREDDDGISLLSQTCAEFSTRFRRIGFTLGPQSMLRMPINDFNACKQRLKGAEIVDVAALMHQLLSIKSAPEIEKIRQACQITSNGFNALPEQTAIGDTQRQICTRLKVDLLRHGVDDIPFMASGAGPGGYDSIIMGPTDKSLESGDVLIIDTGATLDGYFCDFDRNYGIGQVDETVKQAYRTVYAATEAGLNTARAGITLSSIYASMWSELVAGGARSSDIGRMGHGLGMQLTEWPSITATEETLTKPGMVLTLEPAMNFAPGKQMVHEENIVITEFGCRLLSQRAWPELKIID